MSGAISHAAMASTRGDALCLVAACIVVRIASFMLIFPYNRSDPLAYVFEHSLTGPLIALNGTRMGGDGFAGSVEPRGAAVGWNRAGSRLRSFALVRQLASLDRPIPPRLVIDTPNAQPLVGCLLHEQIIVQIGRSHD